MKLSLYWKLTIFISFAFILALTVSGLVSMQRQRQFSDLLFEERAVSICHLLDASLVSRDDLSNTEKLQQIVLKSMWLEPEISGIDINLPENGELRVAVSSNSLHLDQAASKEGGVSYQTGRTTSHTFRTEGGRYLATASPIVISGQKVGSYVITMTLAQSDKAIFDQQVFIAVLDFVAIWLGVAYLFILLRGMILTPLRTLARGAEKIGLGKLGYQIKIRTGDELQALATTFNQMSQNLKQSRDLLTQALHSVERKVKERTREIKEAKDKIQLLVDHLGDGLIEYDEDLVAHLMNPRAESMLAVKGNQVIGKVISPQMINDRPFKNIAQVFFPILNPTSKKIAEAKDPYKTIFEISLEEPQALDLQVATIEIKREGGKSRTFLKIIHDITREKAIAEMKSSFVSIAAHQLRTPLAAMKWTLGMMIDGDLGKITGEQKDFLKDGYESNERMIQLVNNLLDVSRIEERRFGYKFVKGNIVELVERVLKEAAAQATERDIKVSFGKPDGKIPPFLMDENRVFQALQNLIENAVRYNLAGGFVRITVEKYKKDKRYVLITVRDNGIGIPKHQMTHLFTPFFRATNAVRLQVQGNGLGLYIVKSIVNHHGGKIWIESKENVGTTAHLTLPLEASLVPKEEEESGAGA